ncbi:MAG: hypothetical protein AVDCRST_MAG69-2178, partial [uncultured Solirubrobacteraceae bacterium]
VHRPPDLLGLRLRGGVGGARGLGRRARAPDLRLRLRPGAGGLARLGRRRRRGGRHPSPSSGLAGGLGRGL